VVVVVVVGAKGSQLVEQRRQPGPEVVQSAVDVQPERSEISSDLQGGGFEPAIQPLETTVYPLEAASSRSRRLSMWSSRVITSAIVGWAIGAS